MNTAEKTEQRKRTLNEIVEDFRRVLHTIDDAEGEILPDLESELTQCEEDLATKVDRCLWVEREMLAQAGVVAERAKALAERSKVLVNQAERLKKHVHASLISLGVTRIETPHFKIAVANTPSSVRIENEEGFIESRLLAKDNNRNGCQMCFLSNPRDPDPFLRVKLEIDKKAVIEHLKSGRSLPGASLYTGTCLKVK